MIQPRLNFNCISAIFLFQLTLLSCNSNSEKQKVFEDEYFPNGKIKTIVTTRGDSSKQVFGFDSVGNLTDMAMSKNSQMQGEHLWFYINGILEQKTTYKFGKPNGYSYQYYPSGAIKSNRFLRNGLEQGFGLDYYDSPFGIAKSSLYFNDSGKIYYKQNFDISGSLVNEEGEKPKSLQ